MSNVQTIKNINPTTNAILIAGIALPSVAPATPQFKARKTTKITWYSFNNTDIATRTVTAWIIPPGGTANVSTNVGTYSLTAAGTAGAALSFASGEIMLPGYTLLILGNAANVVRCSVSGEIQT